MLSPCPPSTGRSGLAAGEEEGQTNKTFGSIPFFCPWHTSGVSRSGCLHCLCVSRQITECFVGCVTKLFAPAMHKRKKNGKEAFGEHELSSTDVTHSCPSSNSRVRKAQDGSPAVGSRLEKNALSGGQEATSPRM